MDAFHYFLVIDKSIKNLASKADLILFDGKISKKDKDDLFEDCLVLSCIYTSFYKQKPPFLLDFIESDNTVSKLTKSQREEMGAFFTPVYIAEYIVENTIGPLIEEMPKNGRVKKILKLKICDPAMGGGVFLVCAHDFLMKNIVENIRNEEKENLGLYARQASKCVFGIDINPKAVEFSKLIMHLNIAKWSLCNNLIDEYVLFARKNSI